MKFLLDTHVFLWWLRNDPRLSVAASAVLKDSDSELYLSSVSGCEIATKVAIGKLKLPTKVDEFISAGMTQGRVQECALTMTHTYRLASLPLHHRDPFDRLLIATSLEENFTLLTDDVEVRRYAVKLAW